MSRQRLLGRIGITVLAFAGGVLVAVVTTFTHRQSPPWILILGVLIIGALVAGLRLAFSGRLPAGAATAGILLSIAVLSLRSNGGTVLVANDALGVVWSIAPIFVAGIIVAWPQPRLAVAAREEAPVSAE